MQLLGDAIDFKMECIVSHNAWETYLWKSKGEEKMEINLKRGSQSDRIKRLIEKLILLSKS